MPKCLLLSFLLLGWVRLDALAQFATISGQVVSAESGVPLTGVNLRLLGEDGLRGTASGGDGRFTIASIPPGTHVLTATHVGFAPWSDTVSVAFREQLRLEIRLHEAAEPLDEVVVESDDDEKPTISEGAGHIRVRGADLQRVPMPDVSSDLAAYLLTRPGIVSPGDRGGQLFIRGGTPAQNLVLLDGMHIYRPFHIVGFYSIFPADIVSQADVYAGGFGAEYGGRISSVIDVTTRNGNKQELSGSASIAPFLASVRAEIPFVPNRISLLASVRESVIERLAPDLIGRHLPYRFGDRFLKLHAFLNRTSSFSATLLHSFDEGDIAGIEGDPRPSTWTNTAGGARYFYLPEDLAASAEFAIYGTRYESTYQPSAGERRTSNVETVDLKIRFSYLLAALQLRVGLNGTTNWLSYDLGERYPAQEQNFTEGGLFTSIHWSGEHFHLEPGVRLQMYSGTVGGTLEPRLRATWKPGGTDARQTFSAAWGLYHQQFLGLNNQSDVTDAFTAWAAPPDHTPLPRSMHFIAGWQRQLATLLTLHVEGYHRSVQNILFPRQDVGGDPRFDRVDGRARGLDLTLEFQRPWLHLYAGYGLSLVRYDHPAGGLTLGGSDLSAGDLTDPEAGPQSGPNSVGSSGESANPSDSFTPPHDRRHNVNAQVQLSHGPYRLSIRWQFGSGIPFTPVMNYFYVSPPLRRGDRTFLTDPGSVRVSHGEPYSRRLPAYHRLDISAERDFRFAGWRLVLQAGVVNAYNRPNIFSYDVLSGRRVDQLPLIPSAGVRVVIDG